MNFVSIFFSDTFTPRHEYHTEENILLLTEQCYNIMHVKTFTAPVAYLPYLGPSALGERKSFGGGSCLYYGGCIYTSTEWLCQQHSTLVNQNNVQLDIVLGRKHNSMPQTCPKVKRK